MYDIDAIYTFLGRGNDFPSSAGLPSQIRHLRARLHLHQSHERVRLRRETFQHHATQHLLC